MQNLSERAHDLIRLDIIAGTLAPGEKLLIEAVSARYGIGVNPVREALNRLSSEGLVERRSQRGFFVTALSPDDLEELVKTRIWVETLALTQSIANGEERWEEELIIAHHHLARCKSRAGEGAPVLLNREWQQRHKAFHMALLSRCGSTPLLEFCSRMMDQAERYRNISVARNWERRGDAAKEHEEILNAVLDRDAPRATRLLTEHYSATLDGLRDMTRSDHPRADDAGARKVRPHADTESTS